MIIPCVWCLLYFGHGLLFLNLCDSCRLTSYSVLHTTSREIILFCWSRNKYGIIKLCYIIKLGKILKIRKIFTLFD